MSSLTITLIQSDLHWNDKKANLQLFTDKINSIRERTEIVILPEMFSTGFSMEPEKYAEPMDGEVVSWMRKTAADKKIILTGSVMIKEHDKYYNRLIWMLPNGEMGIYDKKHLFAYAEEDKHYTPGNKRLIASVKGWKINLMVCYDLRFPVWARQSRKEAGTTDAEYDLLIYVANWPERRSHAWKTLLQARSIENQCFCIGLNRVGKDGKDIFYSGDSMVVNPLGEVLYQKQHEEAIHTIILHKQDLNDTRFKLPFLRDADPFLLLND